MSGICGLFNLDGAQVDRELLDTLTEAITFRGPDAKSVWSQAAVGLGHTLLRTTFEAESERQPASFDGQVWISADARIDGQAELRLELLKQGRVDLDSALDHELILHSYHAWGEACVEHLIGDFSFAIWDGPKQKLFCARDHFGIKPFFYAQVGKRFVFSNTLSCVRSHPLVSDRLNELAIADFLLFECNQEPGTTTFADIQRLPPAHCFVLSSQGIELRQYWVVPTDITVCYRPEGDYVTHFMRLLEVAVSDRLRTDSVGLELSGGLDSSAMAAVAKAVLSRSGSSFQICADTIVYDSLVPDQERHYSRLVAEKLGIPQTVRAADDYQLFERYDEALAHMTEPVHDPTAIRNHDRKDAMPKSQRVVLTGWDGDSLLNESPKPYFRQLRRRGDYRRLVTGVVGYTLWKRRTGPLVWRTWWANLFRKPEELESSYPVWLNPDFENRLGLRARFERLSHKRVADHPLRPRALYCLDAMQGPSSFFEDHDAGQSGLTVEYRHPLLDLRVVNYCLSLPPYPWCIQKFILREGMRGLLPEAVRRRPKSPLAAHPHIPLLHPSRAKWVDDFVASPKLNAYIDRTKIPSVVGESDPVAAWIGLRPLSLDQWLRYHEPST